MLLDGREVVEKVINNIDKEEIKRKRIRCVFIQVGEDFASNKYIANKIKLCEEFGIIAHHLKLDEAVQESTILTVIDELNKSEEITGIMVQLPLPTHINEDKIINAISPKKDIDGFSNANKGKLMSGDASGIIPCTPKGIMTILEIYNLDNLEGKTVLIAGRSNIVGKPLAQLMINKGATVIVANSKTPEKQLAKMISNSDIFVSAIGKANYFNKQWFIDNGVINDKICSIAIDVGINRDENDKLCGDINRELYDAFDFITPVPNGVGKTTVLEVIRNIIKCYEMQNK